MAKKTKAKKISFRQRLRNEASDRLDVMVEAVRIAVTEVVAPHSQINPADVMRLLSAGQTKTLREDLITELANEREVELEKFYNTQMNLLKEDPDGDKKEG